MTADLPSVALVVVNFGVTGMVEENVTASMAASPDIDVIVVDNYSSAGERSRIKAVAEKHGWTLVSPPVNVGFGAGVNLGAAVAVSRGATHLLLLNPDATIDAHSIAALTDTVSRPGPPVLASPVVRRPGGAVWFGGMAVDLRDGSMHRADVSRPSPGTIPWLTGACMMMKTDVWHAVAGFDERYFLYWEDVDLSARALAAGVRLELVPQAEVIHAVGGTHQSSDRAKSNLYYYFNIRNRMLFAAAHLDADGIRRWRRRSLASARAILLRGGRRQFLRGWGPLVASARGLRDGRAIARRRLDEIAATKPG